MAKAYICDRCKKVFEIDPMDIPAYRIVDVRWNGSEATEIPVDLCPQCERDLVDFMAGHKINSSEIIGFEKGE